METAQLTEGDWVGCSSEVVDAAAGKGDSARGVEGGVAL